MRPAITLIALFCALLLWGCVPSLNPLYTPQDVVFDSTLVGYWIMEGGDAFEFRHQTSLSYTLTYTEGGVAAKFETHLVKLGECLFLDTFPSEPDIKNDFYAAHLVRAHTFSRIWIAPDTLRLAPLQPDWMRELLSKGGTTVAHEMVGDQLVLTATTVDLQKLLLAYADDPRAFSNVSLLVRQ